MTVIFYSFLSQSYRQVGGYFEQRGDIEQSYVFIGTHVSITGISHKLFVF